MLLISLLAAGQASGLTSTLLMLVIMFGIMWLFIIMPQRKQQQKLREFRQSIEKGTEVITAGGIYGVVRDIDDASNALIVEIASGVRIRIDRNSVFASAQDVAGQQKS